MSEHINAKKNEIAETVIMPGDPLRAEFIAKNFLDEYKLVNTTRAMYAYTGKYKGKEITVMAHGMGMPSVGIYTYELYKFYNVKNIIRIGTAGSYTKNINVYDLVLAKESFSDSSYAKIQNGSNENILKSSKELNEIILNKAKELNYDIKYEKIYSTDVFYKENDNYKEILNKYKCTAVEMESFALFHNANILKRKAACILTISNSFITNETTTSLEREQNLKKMITLALESALEI